eukprot:m.262255 g.262255  ORF g.262255 m.262255 type:complete len:109 (+) comp11047_c0_seq22:2058-2384(+)
MAARHRAAHSGLPTLPLSLRFACETEGEKGLQTSNFSLALFSQTQRITDLETWRASMLASQTKAGAAARAVTPTTTAAANTNPLFVIKEHAVLLVIVVIIQLFLNFVM